MIYLYKIAAGNIDGGMDNRSATESIFHYIIDSDIFKILMAIGVALYATLTVAMLMGPMGFVESMIAPLLIQVIISGVIGVAAITLMGSGTDVFGWITESVYDFLNNNLTSGMAGVMGATSGTIGWLATLMSLTPDIAGLKAFAFSSLGAILSFVGCIKQDLVDPLYIGIGGFILSAMGWIEIFIYPNDSLKDNPTAWGIWKGISSIDLGISTFGLTTTVVQHG